MKRLRTCLVVLFLLAAYSCGAIDIYLSPTGSDANAGTRDSPLASLSAALRKARELRRLNDPSVSTGINIILDGGNYQLSDPIFIRPEDSGTESSPTIIKAAGGAAPVLHGGTRLTGWKVLHQPPPGLPASARGKVWVANAPASIRNIGGFRSMWVNGIKAIRAREQNGDSMSRILSWNKTEQTCWIPTPKPATVTTLHGLEMIIHQWWAIAILRVSRAEQHGESTKLFFHQPESRIQSEHPWPAPWISNETGNSAFYLVNAIHFLDEPGEWYYDRAKEKIYYWPRAGEALNNDEVIIPVLENLVRIEGTPRDPVKHVKFHGIAFEYTGWMRPSTHGHVPLQAGMYLLDAYKLKTPGTDDKPTLENQAWIGRPAAAVRLTYARNIDFTACRFMHLASTALDQEKGTKQNTVLGNLFRDIGGSAIVAGVFSDEAVETHLPYRDVPETELCDSLRFTSNLITDVANEDWGAVGIAAGWVRNILINHNELSHLSYTGISLGWGWTQTESIMRNNRVLNNRIHHYGKHMYDVAGIYTLSSQPGSIISGNYVYDVYKARYAHIPGHWFYIYTDEGSSHFTIRDNLCRSEKFLENANGPGNSWSNNGPSAGATIMENAGLYPSYCHLLKERTLDNAHPLAHDIPVMLELVVNSPGAGDVTLLKSILRKSRMDTSSIYQWQNRYVIFGKVQDAFVLKQRIRHSFPSADLRSYDDMFYEFNRSRCGDPLTANEWEHIILTANLVKDSRLQKEYLGYHATQFENWPDVAKGFCRAQFQQLLLFRHGRQLMLVISIPKGESLDRLNPLTTESNPKMIEWNNLMKKYQEGITGTTKDEVWVFLSQVK